MASYSYHPFSDKAHQLLLGARRGGAQGHAQKGHAWLPREESRPVVGLPGTQV